MNKNWPDHRHATLAGALVAALLVSSPHAAALTLGRAQVQSQLGESMRAEIEFENLSAEEAETLRARIAPAEAYRQAGIELNPALAGARVVLQRIANKRSSLRITTDRVVQEPFLELIVELTWRSGSLVRSYTLLFDLPSNRTVATPPAFSQSGIGSAAPALVSPPGLTERPVFDSPSGVRPRRSTSAAAAPRRGPPPPGAPPAPALIDDPYRVRPGDTLSELAQRGPRPAGVSLDRLVLAMYRENQEAFLGGNMHRLRKGAVLKAPSEKMIESISQTEALREIRAQSADFGGYRGRLAAMPTERQEGDTRRASGKLQAAVEDSRPTAAAPDKLTLSKPVAPGASDAEARAAAEAQRRVAAERVAELARNVQELGRLSAASAAAPAPTASTAAAGPASAPGALTLPTAVPPVPAAQPASASAPVSASHRHRHRRPCPCLAPRPRPRRFRPAHRSCQRSPCPRRLRRPNPA